MLAGSIIPWISSVARMFLFVMYGGKNEEGRKAGENEFFLYL